MASEVSETLSLLRVCVVVVVAAEVVGCVGAERL